jgi:arabinose-5-phosphate isomerase
MSDILDIAKRVLNIEAEGVLRLIDRLDGGFEQMVGMILNAPGNKVILTGIGKSGIVARKIMATLNSTGTTAIFLHPVEALHGDMGMVSEGDVVLAVSHSGHTEELISLVPVLVARGARVVAMTGGLDSPLARLSQVVVDCGVEREACPLGLAPTTSTTAALAMGDALAVVLIEKHRFSAERFRFNHPGGHLGQRLSSKVSEVMTQADSVPQAEPDLPVAQAAEAMDQGSLGTLLITSGDNLVGIFTDGDLRRAVVKGLDLGATPVSAIMTPKPETVGPQALAADAMQRMANKEITALPVVAEGNQLVGLVHLHDLLGRGQVVFQAVPERSSE